MQYHTITGIKISKFVTFEFVTLRNNYHALLINAFNLNSDKSVLELRDCSEPKVTKLLIKAFRALKLTAFLKLSYLFDLYKRIRRNK